MSWQRLQNIELDIETHKQEIKKLKVLRNKELGALRDLHKDMSALIQQLQSLLKREQTRQVQKQIEEIHRLIGEARSKHVKF
tara:strand:+ start:508 stop:753 length:246 start_codon:yes stop_codon:yes gene_type:complete